MITTSESDWDVIQSTVILEQMVLMRTCGGVVVWWCDGVVVWWCGGAVVWWCGGVVV